MTPKAFINNAIVPALRLLPENMDTQPARAMMVAIALQESRIRNRRQIGGPAHGYWQFEQGGGVKGVLNHPATRAHIQSVLKALDYTPEADQQACYVAIEHNDILAAAFARLLLWTLPGGLPLAGEADLGWRQYSASWRPGRPHRDTWDDFFNQAWKEIA